MDRELSIETVKKQKQKRMLHIVIISMAAIFIFGAFRIIIRPVIHLEEIQTIRTDRGDIEASISASGVILPEFEEIITSPVTSRILKVYHNVGEIINHGTIVLLLDKSGDELQLEKMSEELASRQNQKQRLQLNMENTIIDLQTNYEIQRLKSERLRTSYDNEKYIKSLGGTTEEMVKEAELNSKIAQLEIDHLQQSIVNKKASLQTELKDQEYSISIYRKEIQEVQTRLEASSVKAASDGVITWINDKIGSTVSTGSELIKMANLSSFKVEGTVSEIYLRKLAIGGKVIVLVNDSALTGTISSINPTVQNDAVKFTVMLEQKNHPVLRSNQKVDINIVTSYRKNVIRLQRKDLTSNGANPYLFVIKGNIAERHLVKFGESNFNYIEIEKGIGAGEEVIVSDMDSKKHLERIKIKL